MLFRSIQHPQFRRTCLRSGSTGRRHVSMCHARACIRFVHSPDEGNRWWVVNYTYSETTATTNRDHRLVRGPPRSMTRPVLLFARGAWGSRSLFVGTEYFHLPLLPTDRAADSNDSVPGTVDRKQGDYEAMEVNGWCFLHQSVRLSCLLGG